MSKVVCIPLSRISLVRWSSGRRVWTWVLPQQKQHTYVVVFGPYNEEGLTAIQQWKDINILAITPKAMNRNHPGTPARNTVVVFEVKETENV